MCSYEIKEKGISEEKPTKEDKKQNGCGEWWPTILARESRRLLELIYNGELGLFGCKENLNSIWLIGVDTFDAKCDIFN